MSDLCLWVYGVILSRDEMIAYNGSTLLDNDKTVKQWKSDGINDSVEFSYSQDRQADWFCPWSDANDSEISEQDLSVFIVGAKIGAIDAHYSVPAISPLEDEVLDTLRLDVIKELTNAKITKSPSIIYVNKSGYRDRKTSTIGYGIIISQNDIRSFNDMFCTNDSPKHWLHTPFYKSYQIESPKKYPRRYGFIEGFPDIHCDHIDFEWHASFPGVKNNNGIDASFYNNEYPHDDNRREIGFIGLILGDLAGNNTPIVVPAAERIAQPLKDELNAFLQLANLGDRHPRIICTSDENR